MAGGVTRAVYEARVERVRQLALEGLKRKEIAAAIGLTEAGVNGLCRRKRIHTKPYRILAPAEHAHPLVRELMAKIREQRTTYELVERRAGIGSNVVNRWRCSTMPRLDNFEAVLNVLGYELVIRPRRDDA